MILNKNDLNEYILCDAKNLGVSHFTGKICNNNFKFQYSLRHLEFYTNAHSSIINKIMWLIWKLIYRHYSYKMGFDIPVNTCGKGLNIHHHGCVVINGNARIGENCNIQQCVNIGQNYGSENVPVIGNNVYIGPGAKIFDKIYIADNIAIGANAVVNKSCYVVGGY